MVSPQGRRESGDPGIRFSPAHPELPRQLCHRWVRRREPDEKDQSVHRRYSSYLASPEVIDIARTHSVLQQRDDLYRFIDLVHGRTENNKALSRHIWSQTITEPIEIPGKFERKSRLNLTTTKRAASTNVLSSLREGQHFEATMRAPSDREARWQDHRARAPGHTTFLQRIRAGADRHVDCPFEREKSLQFSTSPSHLEMVSTVLY